LGLVDHFSVWSVAMELGDKVAYLAHYAVDGVHALLHEGRIVGAVFGKSVRDSSHECCQKEPE